jgi:GTP diphosphokinase / guanosine-3',5'-bis(diphosphate) 3'-diphosphatase
VDLFTGVYILPRLNGKTFTGVFMHAPADVLEKALGIALIAHAGQKDKAGAPYIMHPLRLMMTAAGLDAQVTALLHDVLEDSDITEDDLYAAGIPPHICAAVATLTRQLDETYEEFIERIACDELARRVKILDIQDNLNLQRLKSVNKADLLRVTEYHRALQFLLQIDAVDEEAGDLESY